MSPLLSHDTYHPPSFSCITGAGTRDTHTVPGRLWPTRIAASASVPKRCEVQGMHPEGRVSKLSATANFTRQSARAAGPFHLQCVCNSISGRSSAFARATRMRTGVIATRARACPTKIRPDDCAARAWRMLLPANSTQYRRRNHMQCTSARLVLAGRECLGRTQRAAWAMRAICTLRNTGRTRCTDHRALYRLAIAECVVVQGREQRGRTLFQFEVARPAAWPILRMHRRRRTTSGAWILCRVARQAGRAHVMRCRGDLHPGTGMQLAHASEIAKRSKSQKTRRCRGEASCGCHSQRKLVSQSASECKPGG